MLQPHEQNKRDERRRHEVVKYYCDLVRRAASGKDVTLPGTSRARPERAAIVKSVLWCAN